MSEGGDDFGASSPLIGDKSDNRFKVNFVDQSDPKSGERDRSDTVTSKPDNQSSHHTANDTHRSQGTFHYTSYQVFNTLDYGPKTAFYRRTNNDARPTMEDIRSGKNIKKPETPKIRSDQNTAGSVKFGWIQGVLVRCLLNIWGVMLFIRIAWVIGQAGIAGGVGIILLSSVVTGLTTLSLAAICTNGEVKGGGAYYLISRSLGPEFGGAIGIIFSIANAIAVAMYIVGFTETLVGLLKDAADFSLTGNDQNDMRVWGLIALLLLFGISMAGMAWESKAQVILLFVLLAAMVNFVAGTFITTSSKAVKGVVGYNVEVAKFNLLPHFTEGETFFSVFAVFFPASTGIMAGANISGDLANPSAAIPKGTFLAILISTVSYVVFAVQAGVTTLLSTPANADVYNGSYIPDMNASIYCIFGDYSLPQKNCTAGLLYSMNAMATISGWPPLITVGVFAATLSSALASLVSAPKVFQAVCSDKLFPYIDWFAKGYGSNNEPWRAYILTLFIAAAFVSIAKLNAIAPIITNFFLISYALINYSCFEASWSNSPGWRPSYKYYNIWTSLAGAVLCGAVMFITSWWTALITVVIIVILYRYIQHTKPEVNWGSSKEALKYNKALSFIHDLSGTTIHVKNFRPQFLVLTGLPSSRPRLVSFVSQVSKGYGVMICGDVLTKRYRNPMKYNWNDTQWLLDNKVKAFHCPITALDFRMGANTLLQSNGLGSIKANTLILGYCSKWQTYSDEALQNYVGVIEDAFDLNYAVGILRYNEGLDIANLAGNNVMYPVDAAPSSENLTKDQSEPKIPPTPSSDRFTLRKVPSKESVGKDADGEGGDEEEKDTAAVQNDAVKVEIKSAKSEDIEMNVVEQSRVESPDIAISQYRGFGNGEKPAGTIDVYWLSDDGGLSVLVPYLLSQSSFWSNTKLRIFASGNESDIAKDRFRMAALLSKFRIEFSSVEIVAGLEMEPTPESIKEYESFGFMSASPEATAASEEENSEEAKGELDAKTKQYIRTGELLRLTSTDDTQLIVVTLPVPRDHTPCRQYMSWLESISRNLPPILMLRGNQQDALTFYC